MDNEQRFLLDLNGYLHLRGVLSSRELAACRAAADRHIALCEAVADGSAAPDAVPEGFGNGAKPGQPGGKGYSNGFAWEKPLEQLLFHRKLWPIVRSLNTIAASDSHEFARGGSFSVTCGRATLSIEHFTSLTAHTRTRTCTHTHARARARAHTHTLCAMRPMR